MTPGTVKIHVRGDWDIEDLFYFVETFRDGYSLFYYLTNMPIRLAQVNYSG